MLNLAATNAAISKYYIHDVSDLIDVSSWGVYVDDLPGESHQLREGWPLFFADMWGGWWPQEP